jgi:asparagine synthase (glutamine-hydrolysing)
MIRMQSHRGPDDHGTYRDQRAVLGHCRLSIQDLSAAGHQPMTNEDGTIWVTYNGEIYNCAELKNTLEAAGHHFVGHSDTEVLIHGYEEWGIDRLLSKLRGMFAFALWDSRTLRLILARDRFGIKPLYYSQNTNGTAVAFASEVRPLRTVWQRGAETDRVALTGFLLFGSIPAPRTIAQGVQCLPAAHYLMLSSERRQLTRYWELAVPTEPDFRDDTGPDFDIAETLRDSMKSHLISDVPVGVFLSGGMDSAAIVAVCSHVSSRLTTVTISFGESQFDESANARAVADRFGSEHHEVRISRADFMRDIPALLDAMDQPTNDGVNTYCVSKAARQIGLKVVLSGLGGDEVFWGYPHYRWIAGRRPWLRMLLESPATLRRAAVFGASAYGRIRGQEKWGRLEYLHHDPSYRGVYFAARGFFSPRQVCRLTGFSPAEVNDIAAGILTDGLSCKIDQASSPATVNYLELTRYLHDQLLRDADVFSMAHSIEMRVPFLDHELVSRMARVSARKKIGQTTNKPLLREAVNDAAVGDAAARKKKGFAFPISAWMSANFGMFREMATQCDYLDRNATATLLDAFRLGRLHWSRAWALVTLSNSLYAHRAENPGLLPNPTLFCGPESGLGITSFY